MLFTSRSVNDYHDIKRYKVKGAEIFLNSLLSVTEISREHWLQEGFKEASFTEKAFTFRLDTSHRSGHYIRERDERSICSWILALNQTKTLLGGKSLLNAHQKDQLLERVYQRGFKGGFIRSSYEESWLYEPTGKLTMFETNQTSSDNIVYWWNGRTLTPSAGDTYGNGSWDGVHLQWTSVPADDKSFVYRWNDEENQFTMDTAINENKITANSNQNVTTTTITASSTTNKSDNSNNSDNNQRRSTTSNSSLSNSISISSSSNNNNNTNNNSNSNSSNSAISTNTTVNATTGVINSPRNTISTAVNSLNCNAMGSVWHWKDNRLISESFEWEVIGDVPACVCMLLQLMRESRIQSQH